MSNNIVKNFVHLKQNWPYLRKPTLQPTTDHSIPVPGDSNRNRIGASSTSDFTVGGLRDIVSVINIAETYRYINEDTILLDWGVGCARVSRHIPSCLRDKFIGIDVDPKNIQWCKDNIRWGTYKVCQPHGPLDISDSSIDLLIGLSVFTHLSEVSQAYWLQEINRVIKGTALLSIHGLYSVTASTWGVVPELLDKWLCEGYRDAESPNPDISDVTPRDYYRDVAHTPEYIYKVWSQYIDIIDIIPAGIAYHHDLVVCRKKQP